MSDIKINSLSKSFGEKKVLYSFTCEMEKGGLYCLMGPSGCGKTTLLRILAGLDTADEGDITGIGRVSVLFQEDRLIPHLTALQNVCLTSGDIKKAEQALVRAGLSESFNVRAKALSGGMARRTALVRALLYESDTLLLDEPFKGLDPETKKTMVCLLKEHLGNRTLVCVTHDAEEAEMLSAHILHCSFVNDVRPGND